MMVRKTFLLAAVLSVFCLLAPAADGFFGTTPSLETAEWQTLQNKIDWSLVTIPLPQDVVDFITREALACRLSMRVATLEANVIAQMLYWASTSTREITLSEVSTWDAVGAQHIVHELAHAGAKGTGNDAQGYNKQKEVNARKREAEYWKDATPKPARDSEAGFNCWANYDTVFNADGTQRSHDEIKRRLKTVYGYSQAKM